MVPVLGETMKGAALAVARLMLPEEHAKEVFEEAPSRIIGGTAFCNKRECDYDNDDPVLALFVFDMVNYTESEVADHLASLISEVGL